MSPEQLTALLVAAAALVTALTAMFVQIRQLSARVDGRLTELLELTATSAHAEGVKQAGDAPTIGSSAHTA